MGKPTGFKFRAPTYFWDFNPAGSDRIIVQSSSDHPKLPDIIAEFSAADDGIGKAERLIAELQAGRADPRRVNI